jgi:hypothetical protein
MCSHNPPPNDSQDLRNQVVSSLVWLWWVIDLVRFYFESMTFWLFYLYLCFLAGESCLLVSWCAGGRCGMSCSDEDYGRSRRPGTEDRGWSDTYRVLGGQTIEISGDIVCGLHRAQGDEERVFLGWALKPRSMVCQWFDLKTTETVFQWFSLKTTGTVSPGLASKSVASGFSVWASKSAATIWWFGPQNYRNDFLVWASKSRGLWFISCAIKPMGGWRRRGTRVEI